MKSGHEHSGKIILPHYPFRHDLRAGKSLGTAENPVIFRLSNRNRSSDDDHRTFLYMGLLEFHQDTAELVYLPYWAIQQLGLELGQLVRVQSVEARTLAKARSIKIQPVQSDFVTKLEDPRQVIENHLNQHISAVSLNQQLTLSYNDQEYDLLVQELRDGDNKVLSEADLTNVDLNLEFEAPVDEQSRQLAQENQLQNRAQEAEQQLKDTNHQMSFAEQMTAIRIQREAQRAIQLKKAEAEAKAKPQPRYFPGCGLSLDGKVSIQNPLKQADSESESSSDSE